MPKLDEYRRKRDFAKTPEPPPGDPNAAARNLVFVIQQHAATNMHWDFRLEVDGVLKSWPLPKGPSLDPQVKRMAVMTEDHPYDYRNFEGVIPKGEYGGGQVIVWDEGIYTPDEDGVTSWDDKDEGSRRMLEGIERGKLSFTLQGKKLHGSYALVKTKYAPNSWLMIKHKDEFVSERNVLEEDKSVRSGLTIQDLKEGRIPNPASASVESHADARAAPFPNPSSVRPMLATLVDDPFDRAGWLWEPKLDGIRVLAYVNDGKVELRSRRGVDITKQYPSLCDSLKAQHVQSAVLDGEICALDEDGVPHFQLLQPRINLTRGVDPRRVDAEQPVVFFVFDMLYLDGFDLKQVPLKERKELIATHIATTNDLRLVQAIEEYGRAVAEGAEALGFEGVVGKRADSRYEPGARSKYWLKSKHVKEQEFVIGGYTKGEGSRSKTFGALAIGVYDDAGGLRWAGNVGSGFDDKELTKVLARLRELETKDSPFTEKVPGVTYVRPELIAQVKYAEWTKDDRLRAPVYLGLRDDIEPHNVHREKAADEAAVLAETEAGADSADLDDGASLEKLRRNGARGEKRQARLGNGNGVIANATGGAVLKGRSTKDVKVSGPNLAAPISSAVRSVLEQLENPKQSFALDVEGEPVKVTNLDKEFWPEHNGRRPMTKRDLIVFFAKVAPWLLPHLKDRPLTLTRYPNGVLAKPFYQKHYEQPIPSFVETVTIWSESNQADGEYILCNNLATLLWLGQLADLELHAWMARVNPEPDAHGTKTVFGGSERALEESALNYPDFMVFDLDPYIYSGKEGKGEEPEYNQRGWEKTVEIALKLKDLLDQLRLSSFLKTSGKTGLHVYLPVLRHYDYDAIRAATQTIGRFLVQENPKDVTLEWDTSKRKGKVFFDANQNTRGKTLAAQYSPRPTAWGGVSMPIAWSELESIDPVDFNVLTVPDLLAEHGDLWADILNHKSDLSALLSG